MVKIEPARAVGEIDCAVEVRCRDQREHRAKDLLSRQLRLGVGHVDQGRAEERPCLATAETAVEQDPRPLRLRGLDGGLRSLTGFGGDHRTDICAGVGTGAGVQSLCRGAQGLPHLGLAGLIARDHADRPRQAALAGRAEGRSHDRRHRALQIGVLGDDHRVLGAAERLDAFAGLGRTGCDQPGGAGLADERDRVDAVVVEDRLDRLAPAVDEVHDARREDLLIVDQLADPLGGAGVALRGFEDEGVTAGDRVGEEPERDHRGEVEGRYGGHHAHWLAHHLHVEAGCDALQRLALEQVRNPGRRLDRLDAAADLTVGVGERLAHVGGDQRGELRPVPDECVAESQYSPGPFLRRDLAPAGLGGAGGLDGGVDVTGTR